MITISTADLPYRTFYKPFANSSDTGLRKERLGKLKAQLSWLRIDGRMQAALLQQEKQRCSCAEKPFGIFVKGIIPDNMLTLYIITPLNCV